MALLGAALFALLSTAAPSTARAQGADSAEVHFKHGVGLYQDSDYKAALVEFRRAYELSKNWRVLYNVAQAEFQSLDYPAALETFERYLVQGGDKVPRARQKEVQDEIAQLRMRVGRVHLVSAVAGATVAIDDVVVGTTPLERDVVVGTGTHGVVVKKPGFMTFTRSVDVAGGDVVAVDAALQEQGEQPAGGGGGAASSGGGSSNAGGADDHGHGPSGSAGSGGAKRVHVFWPGVVATGVLAAAAVTTGIVAVTSASELSSDRNKFAVSGDRLSSDASRVKLWSLVSDVCTVGAVLAGGATLYLSIAPSPFGGRNGATGTTATVAGTF